MGKWKITGISLAVLIIAGVIFVNSPWLIAAAFYFLQPSESRRPLPNLHFLGGDGVERGDSCRVDLARDACRLGLRGAVRAGLDGELRALRGDATA